MDPLVGLSELNRANINALSLTVSSKHKYKTTGVASRENTDTRVGLSDKAKKEYDRLSMMLDASFAKKGHVLHTSQETETETSNHAIASMSSIDKGFDIGSSKGFDTGSCKGFDKGFGKGSGKSFNKGFNKGSCKSFNKGSNKGSGKRLNQSFGKGKGLDQNSGNGNGSNCYMQPCLLPPPIRTPPGLEPHVFRAPPGLYSRYEDIMFCWVWEFNFPALP